MTVPNVLYDYDKGCLSTCALPPGRAERQGVRCAQDVT